MFIKQAKLSDRQFDKFRSYIYNKCAIKLSPLKKTMLTARLNRRLKACKITTFAEYYNYLTSPAGEANELVFMINEVSTNKTDFFREPDHFTFLTSHLLPKLSQKKRIPGSKFKVWSAGCSSGEEPYTLAMVLAAYQKDNPWLDFSITATDISTKVLEIAQKGIYNDDRLLTVSALYRTKYMMRGKGAMQGAHKIVPELIKKINFKRLNFLAKNFELGKGQFDLILCRNVIIYFDHHTQVNLFHKFHQNLAPGGFMFIGHSETMPGLEDKFSRVHSAVYKKL